MFQNKVNNIIYDIAQEEGLTYKEVKNIINSHFLFARIKMALGNPEEGKESFKQVRLPVFGNFATYDRTIKEFNDRGNKLTEDHTLSREKYRRWEMLDKKKALTKEEREEYNKLVKIEL